MTQACTECISPHNSNLAPDFHFLAPLEDLSTLIISSQQVQGVLNRCSIQQQLLSSEVWVLLLELDRIC